MRPSAASGRQRAIELVKEAEDVSKSPSRTPQENSKETTNILSPTLWKTSCPDRGPVILALSQMPSTHENQLALINRHLLPR